MPSRAEPMLVIVDGSLESLVASLLVESPERALAWFVGGIEEEARLVAARAQADLVGMAELIAPSSAERPWESLPGGFGESAMLLGAVFEASNRRCSRVLWPRRASSGSLDEMLDASDRALLVQRLGLIELARSGAPDVRIDTPLLDLTDEQVADLAADLDAPLWSCWWRLDEVRETRAARDEQERWGRRLDAINAGRLLDGTAQRSALSLTPSPPGRGLG